MSRKTDFCRFHLLCLKGPQGRQCLQTEPGTSSASAALLFCAALVLLYWKHPSPALLLTGLLAAVLTGRLTGDAGSSNPVLPLGLPWSGGRVLSEQSTGDREGGVALQIVLWERSVPLHYHIQFSCDVYPVRNEENKTEDLEFASCLIPLFMEKPKCIY